ncbi:hypothetical protein DRN73_01330 [Candidatus Pacearchaeota archaeon]|nr:MAG: hypothetical protein DRN73_01330 [Candidatus Pacearchaeota archaeon]
MEILIFTFLQTIRFIFPIIVIIFIAFFISQILFEIGIFRKIEPIGKVLTKIANLPPIAIISFIASLGSALAGNSILQNLRENKKLTDKEVILCSLFNSSITPIRETFTFHLPVVLPTLGLIVGGFYIITLWLGSIVLLIFTVIAGRLLLPKRNLEEYKYTGNYNFSKSNTKNFKELCTYAFNKTIKQMKRIVFMFLGVTFIVFLCINLGLFKKIKIIVLPLAKLIGLPSQVIPALTLYIVSPVLGYASFSSLLHKGIINSETAIISLLFGSIFMLPIAYLRFFFPQWIAIFGLRLGLIRGLISMNLIILTRFIILITFLNFI